MTIPQVTMVTSCYNLTQFNPGSRSLVENIESFDVLLSLHIYLVIYGDSTTIPILKERRESFGLSSITLYVEKEYEELDVAPYTELVHKNREVYWPSRDSRTCAESHLLCCNKFYFLLDAMNRNPWSHTRFGWIDGNLKMPNPANIKICEDYSPELLLKAVEYTKEDRFHLQALNVVDKKFKDPQNKREFYNQYRWVMCGCFFTFGQNIGKRILERLCEIFVETTAQGYGHAEEMFYLEILDEFRDDLALSYGDYGQIVNNWINPTRNIHYIFYYILQGYSNKGYFEEAIHCGRQLMHAYQMHDIPRNDQMYVDIAEIVYMSYMGLDAMDQAKEFIEGFLRDCAKDPFLHKVYMTKSGFADMISYM